ncbi:hypothetical protein B0F90DRAFT_1817465 [Multifurca ochricompacta]|uniref:Uncharacterized protein n=1 Tax=Multifurca ochricompacta TaxID=376703 RepID=A0AAD4M5W1_9AGAM|nr:hypothetical protein B0F90DRAFT_1817465 [Multifurca ochricompacta]
MSSSLLVNLTRLANEGYPATEVIKYLIDVVGHDVVSFRRNTQVSYMLVDRAREICDAINGHIRRAESGNDWASFEKFTNAIDPIEDALFKLVAFTEDEKALYLAGKTSVEDCITSTEHWATNREEIWKALNVLETKTKLTDLFSEADVSSREADRLEAQNYDDKTFFGEVVEDIKDGLSTLRRVPPAIQNVRTNFDQLLTKLATGSILPWLTVYAVKTGLLVQGMVNMTLRSGPIDAATRNHLRSKLVWEAADELLELLNATTGDGKGSTDQVRLKYEAFLRTLRNTKELALPKSYIELIKQAGRVRRPFHSQAVALISLCRTLVTEFGKEKNHTAENALFLEEFVIFDSPPFGLSLKEAAAAVTELRTVDTENLEEHAAYKALVVAQNRIKICFSAFGLEDDWSAKELLLSDAVTKDKERMDELNKALRTRPPLTTQERAAQAKVTVAVYEKTTPEPQAVHEVTFDVESSARLSAVRWTVAGGLPKQLARRARQEGEFLFGPEDEHRDLHTALSALIDSSNKCKLKLIV